MEGEHFGDDFSDTEEACRIVVDLACLTEETIARDLPTLIERARTWRRMHVSVVD